MHSTHPILTVLLTLAPLALAVQTCDQGYCCDGSIIQQSHSGGVGADNLLCCQGDGGMGIDFSNSAPTTCSAGTAVPLTEVGGAGATGSASVTASGGGTGEVSTSAAAGNEVSSASAEAGNGGGDAASASGNGVGGMVMATAAPWAGVVVAGVQMMVAV